MPPPIQAGVIGATGKTGRSIVSGLLSSPTDFTVTSFTRKESLESDTNQQFKAKGLQIVGYDLSEPRENLVAILKHIDVLISCVTWEHLEMQIPWIQAAKEAGVRRFVPSEWVGPAPRGIIDIKDKIVEVLGTIHRARLPYTIIDVGCWHQVWVPAVPSGRSETGQVMAKYIDHRIVEDGNQKFALTDMHDIGKYVAKIIEDPRTLNRHVFAYTDVLSMNEIWDTMVEVSGDEPSRQYVSTAELHEIIKACGERLKASSESAMHPSNMMDIANYNMGQYRISWCIRGDNTPEYAEYLGYLNFWDLYPDFPRGRSLHEFYRHICDGGSI